MATPFDISSVVPGSIAEEKQVDRMVKAIKQVGLTSGIPQLIKRYIEDLQNPPDAVLDALADHFNVQVWREGWTTSQKQENLKEILRWHELKGTPEGLRRTFDRLTAPYIRIFERRTDRWAFTLRPIYFDNEHLDRKPLDAKPGQFFQDQSLGPFAYWVAVRPGWGAASKYRTAVDLTERVSANRIALTVASGQPSPFVGSVVTGKYDEGVKVEGPDGEYVVGRPEPKDWGLSAWVDVDPSTMDSDGILLAVWKDTNSYMGLRRSGSTSDFELFSVQNGSLVSTSAVFSLPSGFAYLTIRKNGPDLSAFASDTQKASITAPRVGESWQFALGARPSTSNVAPTSHANTAFSDMIIWRTAPSAEEITEQAAKERSLPAEAAGAWPALPRDRT